MQESTGDSIVYGEIIAVQTSGFFFFSFKDERNITFGIAHYLWQICLLLPVDDVSGVSGVRFASVFR